jgi:hypothetical protein
MGMIVKELIALRISAKLAAMMTAPRLILLCAFFLRLAPITLAQSGNCTKIDGSSRPECPRAIEFFRELRTALQSGDRDKVISLVHFPLKVRIHHKPAEIRDKAQLVDHFNEVFDSGIGCSMIQARDEDVWGNWRGFTVGTGSVWVDVILPLDAKQDSKDPNYWKKYPLKIVTVNNDAFYPCHPS